MKKGHATLQSPELDARLMQIVCGEIRRAMIAEASEVAIASLAVDIVRALADADYVIGRVVWEEERLE